MLTEVLKSIDKSKTYSAVFYADGGANPNPGFAGFGVHGYFFIDEKNNAPKKPFLVANHFMEYFNAKPNSVDYAAVTKKGYIPYDQKTIDKHKENLVTPIFYYDRCYSFFEEGTNNTAELSALEDAFQQLLLLIKDNNIKIKFAGFILDSKYVLETVTKYGDAYRRNGWMTSGGTPAKNREKIEVILDLRDKLIAEGVDIKYQWVKGHQGDLGNGMADYQATIAVRRSKAADNHNTSRWSLTKNYWDADVERHPLMTMKRGYFSRVQSFNEPGTYFMIEPSSEELLIGKRSNEAYSIVRLKQPCYYNEKLREAQAQFGQEENRIVLVRNERLYSKFIQKFLREQDHYCLGPSSNKKAVNFLDMQPVALEHNPPTLFYRVLEAFGFLEQRLDEFLNRSENPEDDLTKVGDYNSLTAVDVTSEFYTVEQKKSGKEIIDKMVLKPEFIVGYKNHSFHVEQAIDEKTRKLKISAILGMDLPNRNALKHLEDHKPKIYLLTWQTSADVLQYAFVIDCLTGTSIWSNYYCDRIFLGPMVNHD